MAILASIVWTGEGSGGAVYLASAGQGFDDESFVMGDPSVMVHVCKVPFTFATARSVTVEGAFTNT